MKGLSCGGCLDCALRCRQQRQASRFRTARHYVCVLHMTRCHRHLQPCKWGLHPKWMAQVVRAEDWRQQVCCQGSGQWLRLYGWMRIHPRMWKPVGTLPVILEHAFAGKARDNACGELLVSEPAHWSC
jgi:hypothetical protein